MSRIKRYAAIGNRIKQFRSEKKMTQHEFADILGITQSWLCELETGVKKPSPELLSSLESKYDLDIQWVMTGSCGTDKKSGSIASQIDYSAVGKRIKELRGSENQAQFASRLGLRQVDLSRIERGETRPNADFLCNLHTQTGKSIEWILTGKEYALPSAPSDLLEKIIAICEELLMVGRITLPPLKKAKFMRMAYDDAIKYNLQEREVRAWAVRMIEIF